MGGFASGGPWFAIGIMAMTLAPLVVRLVMVRRARRSIHVFDDVIAYLIMPLLWSTFFLPKDARNIANVVFGVALMLLAVSLGRTIREYLRSRASNGALTGHLPTDKES